ncbi:MAG TPA: Uma2 family endonuclease [Hanamia sp.]
MTQTLIRPPRTMLEIWKSLPESTLCQLVNNKLVLSPSPYDIHQKVLGEISFRISMFLKKNKIGEIRIGLYDVYLSKQNILQPDILFIKNENLNKIKDKGLVGAPDMVIEILSPSNSDLDFEEKRLVYERYGVKEYFIVDPNSKTVYAYFLNKRKYQEQELDDGKIKSALLNTEILF